MPITFNRPRQPLIAAAALLLAPLMPHPAQAQNPERPNSLSGQIQACRQITQDAARLACFDRIALDASRIEMSDRSQTLDRQMPPPKDDTQSSKESNKAERQSDDSQSQEDRFGFAPRPEPGQSDEERSMTVESAEKTLRGQWIIRMENGQIWQQVDTERLSRIKGGLKADIEKGVMSNFIMTIDGRSFRVKRLQ
ncbi:hypothetical protein JCM17846_30070 [Iodidimonas nitroreducens]|uniref:Uncharacterized protein n=1 Tax=Iodidimonas nitroreducens TaxID=1236968 RepID=A0A5A7NCH5_9PROT|nr:hypothetical protein [Iodidimonas nitroreducens]GAK34197.1 hypothetical protein AQ1_02094 [alpha proteobacterium Q-1]GER05325.1 hypothetical protein JCM17846_30070 [Iodidimonas nitroreducens]